MNTQSEATQRDDLYYYCKNRARTAIWNAPLPITHERAEAIVAELQLHTGARAHIAAAAFDEALQDLHLLIASRSDGGER